MKKYISLSLAFMAISGTTMFGATINWGMETQAGTYSNGSPLPDGYSFALGTFQSFIPDGSNTDQWAANFVTSGISNNIATWENLNNASYPNHGAANSGSIFSTGGSVAQNDQAVMWGYNSLDHVGTSEWILITNTAWTFPAPTAPGGTPIEVVNWYSSDAGTNMIFGNGFVNDQGVLNNSVQAQAIPEPSTYALVFGLGILGFLGFRRFRK